MSADNNAGPKAERHTETIPKNNTETRNPDLCAVWGIGNDPKAALCRLGSAREGLGFCLRYGATERL